MVTEYPVYRRQAALIQHETCQAFGRLVDQGDLDAIIVTSSEMMRHFDDWISHYFEPLQQAKIRQMPVVVTHFRIEQVAADCGFSATFRTAAHNRAIISTLYGQVLKTSG